MQRITVILLFLLCSASCVSAQQQKQRKYVFANGGRTLASSAGQLRGTLGQAVVGNSHTSSGKLGAGFWYDRVAQIGLTNPPNPNSISETNPNYTLPVQFGSVFPNPSDGNIMVSFTLLRQDNVEFKVFDILGNNILTTITKEYPAGEQSESLNCFMLSTGIYVVRTTINGQVNNLIFSIQR